MDFVHDALSDGRAFRVLTVIDQWIRWSPILEVAQSMSGVGVAAALDRSIADHWTEFTPRALDEWAYRRGVRLVFTTRGKPAENRHIEWFNGKLRDEWLNTRQFAFVADVTERVEGWRRYYNHHDPHSYLPRGRKRGPAHTADIKPAQTTTP